ncbi:MAG: YraN family protein [Deltaproteobacteria bacterium]|nr:YraN family protein [Deltaproteobacteria bacterium]
MVPKKSAFQKSDLGRRAEDLVADFIREKGFEIIARNQRVGRLEIDIIARKGTLVVFCEVRSRTDDSWMTPAQSIGHAKIERLRRAAIQWLISTQPSATEIRFDVASVVYDVPQGRIDYFDNAF